VANQFTIYKSSDASAPSLTGQTGSLITVLDAVLVNGYGSKAAAGWAKTYSGTSKAVYRAASGARLYYRIQDDGPGLGSFREARLTGYVAMTDVDTGTNPFPTAALAAPLGLGGAFMPIRKSASLDATARSWIIVADARTVYMFFLSGDTAGTYKASTFGEFYSFIRDDAYNGLVCGRLAENNSAANQERLDYLDNALSTTNACFFFPRGHTGFGSAVQGGKMGNTGFGDTNVTLIGNVPFPNPSDGGIYVAPVHIIDPITTPLKGVRGRFRGFWHFCHAAASVTDQDTFTGVGDTFGKTFLFIRDTGNSGVFTIETSATLETN